jgi:hypothetical protein
MPNEERPTCANKPGAIETNPTDAAKHEEKFVPMSKSTAQHGRRHGDDSEGSRWSRAWQRAAEIISRRFAPAEDEGPGRLPDRVVDLLADPEAGERLLRLTRWLVVGAVLIVAITGTVLILHPEVAPGVHPREHSSVTR